MTKIDEPLFPEESDTNDNNAGKKTSLANQIRHLVNSQSFSILCTTGDNQPYGSLIASAHTDDLKHFYFKTQISTRKYRLLSACKQVSLVIDNRCQHQDDMTEVEAVTITGKAEELKSGAAFNNGLRLLKKRHPYMADFLDSPSTALFRIDVVRYFHVIRFQEVSQWIP